MLAEEETMKEEDAVSSSATSGADTPRSSMANEFQQLSPQNLVISKHLPLPSALPVWLFEEAVKTPVEDSVINTSEELYEQPETLAEEQHPFLVCMGHSSSFQGDKTATPVELIQPVGLQHVPVKMHAKSGVRTQMAVDSPLVVAFDTDLDGQKLFANEVLDEKDTDQQVGVMEHMQITRKLVDSTWQSEKLKAGSSINTFGAYSNEEDVEIAL
uniref:Uncharacterized protein n=1 Tax=Ditylenchus dipsaci TaxID=166011 RepID=A0A915CSB9_9BILA